MIPILYEGTEQYFINNGLGRLADAITCKVTEERNGKFELEMTYPITGVHYADIAESEIILAKTEDSGNNQAFIIYKISKPLNGIVTVNAQHISYLLNGFIVMPFSASSCAEAFSKIADNIVLNTPFSFFTDVDSSVAFNLTAPRSVRGLLGGEQGSILDTYGSYDYKFDNFDVYLYQNRGSDNGVSIRYGKNLTSLKNDVDTTSVYTGIVPYWADNEGNTVYLPEKYVLSDHASDYPYYIIQTKDFSSDFETAPTEAQLREKARSYLTSNAGWKLKNSIDVSFVNLGQTEEYKNIAPLERVKLCDYVTVVYSKLGVNVKTKVIKTVYNVLTERYDSISLGDTTYTLAKAIQGAIDSPTTQEVNAGVKSAVARATKLIQGGLGGHVVFNTDGNGEPQEILIMDTDDITTAVNVIRMNLNGIGFSHNGYNGPFDTAWTIDGHFVADYIDTGELNGNLIKANTISANAFTIGANESLGNIYSYVPSDWNTNVNRWEVNASPSISTGTVYIDGVTNTSIFQFYKESGSGYVSSYQTQFKSNYISGAKIHFDLWFNVWRSTAQTVTISTQQFMYLWYPDSNGTWHEQQVFTIGGNYNAQPDNAVYADRLNKLTADITLDYDCDLSQGTPRIGFRFVPIGWIEIIKLDVYSYSGDYSKHLMNFDSKGLAILVQSGNLISSINQSAEAVTIEASKINLTGNLSLRGDFHSYNTNDNTTYAFLNDGKISFFNTGINVFTIASTAVHGQYAGIFFGDADDPMSAQYTSINQETIRTPSLFIGQDPSITPNGLYVDVGAGFHDAARFYANVYNSAGGVQFVSDRRKKKSIKDLATEKAKSFLMALTPRMFKFKEGTSNRYHHGFIAQEVKEAMGGDDWGLYCENKEEDFIGLRYDEFIADLIKVVQDQEKRISELERKIK